ncbi:MAG: hypothetical protein HY675_14545 [Chloroflexi bacterium]|nr:hypothetical protein [Chloroflexota bacterium]
MRNNTPARLRKKPLLEAAPRTELGRRLLALRARALTAGMRLLGEGEVLEEVRKRRGEVKTDDTHVH